MAGAGHLQRGGDRGHCALPRRHRVLGLADGVEGAYHLVPEAGADRRPVVFRRLGLRFGRGERRPVVTAVVDAVLEGGPGLQGIGDAGIVEVDVACEQPLVEDVAERVHRVVGAAVLAAHPELRQEGGAGHADVGLRRADPLAGGACVRAVGQGELHGLLGGPALGRRVGWSRGGSRFSQQVDQAKETDKEGAWQHGGRWQGLLRKARKRPETVGCQAGARSVRRVIAGAGGPSVYTTIVPGVPAAHGPPHHPSGRGRIGKNRGRSLPFGEENLYY